LQPVKCDQAEHGQTHNGLKPPNYRKHWTPAGGLGLREGVGM
jgi:hypothetical protein